MPGLPYLTEPQLASWSILLITAGISGVGRSSFGGSAAQLKGIYVHQEDVYHDRVNTAGRNERPVAFAYWESNECPRTFGLDRNQ